MRTDTQTISLDATPDRVIEFLGDPRNLPRWAVGFARSVRHDDGGWLVETGSGEVGLRIETDSRSGIVDYWMTPAPGVSVLAASRVIPRGHGSEYVFTQFQSQGMPDDAFTRSVQTLRHELVVLKALLEVECPL